MNLILQKVVTVAYVRVSAVVTMSVTKYQTSVTRHGTCNQVLGEGNSGENKQITIYFFFKKKS